MNLIFFSRRVGRTRSLNLSHPLALGALGFVGLAVLSVAFSLGMQLGQRSSAVKSAHAGSLTQLAHEERTELARLREQVQDRIDALSLRIGQLNAHLIRVDALGKRLTQMANISSREFNFDSAPATGGPEDGEMSAGAAARIPDLTQMIDDVARRLDARDAQLLAIENVILSRRLHDAIQPDGRPVLEGYISSYYGDRQDPFTGHEAQHRGIDFAGEVGSSVVAVAAGIVTFAGERTGYGHLVEINHGNGYVTRYAHNQRGLVEAGRLVTRGEPLALMGSSGRSTGPHVHFEVLKDGKQVNPLTFIGR
jgi:murein DD-endopeptidase MepM/ murein hydrolase activator NlpD